MRQKFSVDNGEAEGVAMGQPAGPSARSRKGTPGEGDTYMQVCSFAGRRVALAAFAILVLGALTSDAIAAGPKPHCRRVLINGTAGDTPNEATFQILDQNSNTLAQSCPIQPWDGENSVEYIQRFVYRWTPDPEDDTGLPGTCLPAMPLNDQAGLDLLGPLPKKGCVTLAGGDQPSCTIKYKIAPKDTGTSKKYIEFCCFEDNDDDKLCKTKLDSSATPTPIPITVQVDTNGDLAYCPSSPCDVNCPDCPIVDITSPFVFGMRGPVEPLLGTKHLPSSGGGGCRADLGAALSTFARMGSSMLSRCHADRLGGKLPPSVDCNSIPSTDPKTDGVFASLTTIVEDAAAECASGGSPSAFGYSACPPPCDSIDLAVCSAGTIGAPCASNAECDVAPGDGRCGDWGATGNCLACLAEDAILSSAATVYGDPTPPPPATGDVVKCQEAVGRGLADLTRARVGETISCQKKVDGGAALPAGALVCKDADGKQKVAGAELRARDLILQYCDGTQLAEIGSTCGGATDPVLVGDCVVQNAFAVNDALAYAAFPETTPVCGDGVKEGSEACDAGDDAACPGACLSSCECGVLSPVAGDLSPCEDGVLDRYVFDVTAGQQILVRADTVDLMTAADLCFGAGSGCTNGDSIDGDDDVPCSFPSPLAFDCPETAFIASADGQCTVEVTDCVSDCADPLVANYSLVVQGDLYHAGFRLRLDNEPE
jgi:hypothetical protein